MSARVSLGDGQFTCRFANNSGQPLRTSLRSIRADRIEDTDVLAEKRNSEFADSFLNDVASIDKLPDMRNNTDPAILILKHTVGHSSSSQENCPN
jgi:hypothetical protein